MKLRSTLPILISFFIITSCRNEKDKSDDLITPDTEGTYDTGESPENDSPSSVSQNGSSDAAGGDEDPNGAGDTGESKDRGTGTSAIPEGRYFKDGEEDPSCACYCVEINYSATTELCLKEETIFINARMNRANDGVVNIYLVEAASRNTEGDDIPWDDFDRNIPIATITPAANGEMELDWLGFTINGDLAMDYAIYGKKTLEGTYKKK
jgi:zinc D-Ala-D-Ala carboxypeptidase